MFYSTTNVMNDGDLISLRETTISLADLGSTLLNNQVIVQTLPW